MEPYNTKHAGGRPSLYTTELLEVARAYLEGCEDDEVQQTIGMSAKGTELFKNKVIVNIPTKGGLARRLKVSRETLYAWAKEYPQFSDIMEELGAKQEEALINKGLSGDYNPTIAKVLLTKHGYREGVDNTTNDKDLPSPIMQIIKKPDVLNGLLSNNGNNQDSEPNQED